MKHTTFAITSLIFAISLLEVAGCGSESPTIQTAAGGSKAAVGGANQSTQQGGQSNSSNAGGSAATSRSSSNGGTNSNAGGSTSNSPGSTAGGNPSTNTSTGADGGSGTVQPSDALTLDSSGRVNKDSNTFGIQGSWYWYADFSDGNAGQTKLDGAADKAPPYVEGKGMCVIGTTPGGAKDSYVTWGAGIGLNLNQGTEESGDTTAEKLNPAPKCYTITLSEDSKSPGGILGKLLEANPMPGTTAAPATPQEAPSIELKPGKSTDVCIDNVKQPTWCTATSHKPGDCAEPKNLENGIASIQIQALAGGSGGDIHVCVVSIVPKN